MLVLMLLFMKSWRAPYPYTVLFLLKLTREFYVKTESTPRISIGIQTISPDDKMLIYTLMQFREVSLVSCLDILPDSDLECGLHSVSQECRLSFDNNY